MSGGSNENRRVISEPSEEPVAALTVAMPVVRGVSQRFKGSSKPSIHALADTSSVSTRPSTLKPNSRQVVLVSSDISTGKPTLAMTIRKSMTFTPCSPSTSPQYRSLQLITSGSKLLIRTQASAGPTNSSSIRVPFTKSSSPRDTYL